MLGGEAHEVEVLGVRFNSDRGNAGQCPHQLLVSQNESWRQPAPGRNDQYSLRPLAIRSVNMAGHRETGRHVNQAIDQPLDESDAIVGRKVTVPIHSSRKLTTIDLPNQYVNATGGFDPQARLLRISVLNDAGEPIDRDFGIDKDSYYQTAPSERST